jgi:hypothetical protein
MRTDGAVGLLLKSLPCIVLAVATLTPAAEGALVKVGAKRTNSADQLWARVAAADVNLTAAELTMLNESAIAASPLRSLFELDLAAFDALADKAPQRELNAARPDGGIKISLPLPDGTFEQFSVVETSVLPPELAAAVPETRTYTGVSLDRPGTTASIERTEDGWSAMILGRDGRTFVSPLLRGETTLYSSAGRAEAASAFQCFVEGADGGQAKKEDVKSPPPFGGSSRVYRMALAATGEYTAYFRQPGDTDDKAKLRALDEIAKLVARLNQVYSRELAIQFKLVGSELSIIYTDSTKDPYTNLDSYKLLDENQANLDKVLGNGSYDIGHVVGTGGGGLASLRSTCNGPSKARGETGASRPVSDSFYIDYVAHEIGHQFGANHTFNGTSESCGGGTRSAATAYEPGSGTTIMAYAGICEGQNVAMNSSPYFHAKSLAEITAHITGGGACVNPTNNGNRPPAVAFEDVPAMVPMGTPFELRAAGSDLDGDALDYSFEQYDLGEPSPPDDDSDGKLRPLFRSALASQPSRSFPSIGSLVGSVPSSASYEILPTKSTRLSFRVAARDSRGGFAFADTGVFIVVGAGPFAVEKPAAGAIWKGGQAQTLSWRVANTTAMPLACSAVKISLSTDAGATFAPLVASTPNDGTEVVTMPVVASPQKAILRVDGIGHPFFAMSPQFTISP